MVVVSPSNARAIAESKIATKLASPLTVIRGENVPRATTTSPLANQSFYNDRPLPSSQS